jgi:hypothetical protein
MHDHMGPKEAKELVACRREFITMRDLLFFPQLRFSCQ